MKIYNTFSNNIEEFKSIEKNKIKMYVCGPTVYNYIHIGNARPIIVFDMIARFFKYLSYEVIYVQNFTDVDDKIINKANEENETLENITTKYINAYMEDVSKLNILNDIIRPKVTENIDEIIDIIQILIDKGYAYKQNGDILFSIDKFDKYGELSNQKLEELQAGSRVNVDISKENPFDFVLWKAKKENEPYWDSPFGKGRPGWHIECSAMIDRYLGSNFDIHGGGRDLVFPHHENERAQSIATTGDKFANYWMHNGHVLFNGEKMSKSLNNFYLLRDLLEKYDGNIIRLFILSTHYRKPINFKFEELENTKKTFNNINKNMLKFKELLSKSNNDIDEELVNMNKQYNEKFIESLSDDFNVSEALASIFDNIKLLNKHANNNQITKSFVDSYNSLYIRITDVLGLKIEEKKEDEMANDLIDILLDIREEARKEKNFALADTIRDRLTKLGIEVKDKRI